MSRCALFRNFGPRLGSRAILGAYIPHEKVRSLAIPRRLIVILLCAGLLPLSAAAAVADQKSEVRVTLSDSERDWISAHRPVRWGFDPNWPPFSSFDLNHRVVGIDADLTRLVSRRTGIQLSIVAGKSWADIYAKAKAGEIDFLSATAESPERIGEFNYTRAYVDFPVVIITRSDAAFLTMIRDLSGAKIAAPRDYVVTEHLKHDLPTGHFILTDNVEQAVKLVAHEEADATVQNLAVACRIIRLDGLTNLKISGVTHYGFPLRFAVRKDEPELVSILNKGLETITDDELETIYAGHLTPDIGKARDWGMWRHRAMYAATVGIILTILLLLWNLGLKQEIRRRRAVEARLLEARSDLERQREELAARIKQVERLNGEMQTANHDFESFSVSVSHDLRGPLRRMSSFAELLQKQAGIFLSKPHSEWLDLVVRESKHMDVIIHDLLELARLGRRELRRQRVHLEELARSVIEDFRPHLGARRIIWKVGPMANVYGDPGLLRLVLANLLDNALKFTRHQPQTLIEINTEPAPVDGSQVTVFVKDNGTGFDMKEASKIFEPFQRLQQNHEYEGVGIGLANVKKIVEKHGGRIWCEAAAGQGATFYFTLPAAPAEEKPAVFPQTAGRIEQHH